MTGTKERKSNMPKLIQQKRPKHGDIAVLAYQLWEKNGRPAGKDIEFWLHAEQLIISSFKTRPRSAAKV